MFKQVSIYTFQEEEDVVEAIGVLRRNLSECQTAVGSQIGFDLDQKKVCVTLQFETGSDCAGFDSCKEAILCAHEMPVPVREEKIRYYISNGE